MDRLTLIEKNMNFMCDYAAPSILTGRFVAAIVDSDIETIRTAFEPPGTILVHNTNDLYADQIYTGYQKIHELREGNDRITVILEQ